jgi:hypothetical protein
LSQEPAASSKRQQLETRQFYTKIKIDLISISYSTKEANQIDNAGQI